MERQELDFKVNTGPAGAAILAASLGCFVMGALTTLASKFDYLNALLSWWAPSGALTGIFGAGVFIWILSWLSLHVWLRKRNPSIIPLLVVSFLFLFSALALTFPLLYRSA